MAGPDVSDLQRQLQAVQAERDRAVADAARLSAQMARLTVTDEQQARRVPLPDDLSDPEPVFKSFERATKLANIQPFSGDRKRARAFCDEVSRLIDAYGQQGTAEGFLYSTGRLSGDARLWYEWRMQTAPIYTWRELRPLLLEEYQSTTMTRDAREALDALTQTGTVAQYCSQFRRIIMLLPDLPDAEMQYQFRKKLCSGMKNKISEHEYATVQEMMTRVQHIASRMDPALTVPQAVGLAAVDLAPGHALRRPTFPLHRWDSFLSTTLGRKPYIPHCQEFLLYLFGALWTGGV